jgi:hypothetical protein
MASCTDPTDPADLTAQERLVELAAILGEGVLRLRAGAAPTPPHLPTHTASDSSPNGLADGPETRLHEQRG